MSPLPGMTPVVINNSPYFTLTYKGHGTVWKDAGPIETTMNYDTVVEGSAPAAGDLVVWVWMIGYERYELSPLREWRRIDLTGDGWVQNNQPAPMTTEDTEFYVTSTLAKVVEASDISTPLAIQPGIDADIAANYGFWIAYTVSGSITNLSIPSMTRNYSGGSSPSNISFDSSALTPPESSITVAMSFGSDDSMQLSGITLDKEVSQNDLGDYLTDTADIRVGVKLDVGGASYTLSKGDDGSSNMLLGGYIEIS